MNDPKASDWDKFHTLKQLEMIRETKKQNLLTRVLKESMGTKEILEVTPGVPALIHFLV